MNGYWNGAILDTVDAVVGFARSMTWNKKSPVVRLATRAYESGVRLSKQAMKAVEAKLVRLPQLSAWFIDIHFTSVPA